MKIFLALDAGGTKTDYVLADEQRELARVRTGSIKRMRVDAETASQNLDAALAELSAKTGVPMNAVTRTCVGTTKCLQSSWYLTNVFAGFEIWNGGIGLETTDFSVTVP